MSKPGRRPMPTQLRIVSGNAGKRAVNHAEPEAPSNRPEAPSRLSAKEKKHFNLICDLLDGMKILSAADAITIEHAAFYLEESIALRKQLKKGRFQEITSREGSVTIKVHPAAPLLNADVKILNSLLGELGLTPTARTRIISGDGDGAGKDDLLD